MLRRSSELYLAGETVHDGLALFDRERANIEAAQAWAAARLGRSREAARLCADIPYFGVHVLSLRLSSRALVDWFKAAVEGCQIVGDRRGEGAALGNLGNAWADLGEPRRAIEHYEQHLAIAREIGDRQGEGNALANLGLARAELGEPRKAIELYEQQLRIARAIGDRRAESVVLEISASPGRISASGARRSGISSRFSTSPG